MSIDDVRDYRAELARSVEAMLLRISPFRADIERRLAGEQAVRDCVAEHFGTVGMVAYRAPTEDVPPLPRFEYTQYAPRHADGLALVMPAMIRELVRREEQAQLWTLDVAHVVGLSARLRPRGLPISGDDRPDVRADRRASSTSPRRSSG